MSETEIKQEFGNYFIELLEFIKENFNKGSGLAIDSIVK